MNRGLSPHSATRPQGTHALNRECAGRRPRLCAPLDLVPRGPRRFTNCGPVLPGGGASRTVRAEINENNADFERLRSEIRGGEGKADEASRIRI
jgi:hypothetical protein